MTSVRQRPLAGGGYVMLASTGAPTFAQSMFGQNGANDIANRMFGQRNRAVSLMTLVDALHIPEEYLARVPIANADYAERTDLSAVG